MGFDKFLRSLARISLSALQRTRRNTKEVKSKANAEAAEIAELRREFWWLWPDQNLREKHDFKVP
jgi:hypothetical protein